MNLLPKLRYRIDALIQTFIAVVGSCTPFFAFGAAGDVNDSSTLTGIINTMTNVVKTGVPMLMILLIFYWNISNIIFHADNPEKRKQALPRLVWSVIAIVVFFSLGGLVTVISNTFFNK